MLIIMKLIIVILQCVLFGTLVRAGGPNFDNCDWNGSGTLEMALSRGVQPVYLRCNQGTVRWSYPQGALRVALQQRGHNGAQFSACVRRGRGSSGARLFVAGAQRLSRVFAARDHPDMVRCVSSVGGQVTLYVEADPIADSLRRTATEFSYHLKRADVVDEECQPCTESQLLRQYCSSDFVFQGSVTSLYHDKTLEMTELTVRVSKTHRANEIAKFPRLPSDPGKDTPKYVVLQRPLRCGTKAGSGEYVFMGQWVLDNPTLGCVPRLSEWKKVRRKALESGKNECLLST